MGTPKKRQSRARKMRRRTLAMKYTPPQLIKCANCGNLILPHTRCPNCGYYKGKEITV